MINYGMEIITQFRIFLFEIHWILGLLELTLTLSDELITTST